MFEWNLYLLPNSFCFPVSPVILPPQGPIQSAWESSWEPRLWNMPHPGSKPSRTTCQRWHHVSHLIFLSSHIPKQNKHHLPSLQIRFKCGERYKTLSTASYKEETLNGQDLLPLLMSLTSQMLFRSGVLKRLHGVTGKQNVADRLTKYNPSSITHQGRTFTEFISLICKTWGT